MLEHQAYTDANMIEAGTSSAKVIESSMSTSVEMDPSSVLSYRGIKERQPRYEQIAQEWLKRAEQIDAAEDEEFGDKRGDELPVELKRAETRLARLKEAKAAIEKRAQEEGREEPQSRDQYNFATPSRESCWAATKPSCRATTASWRWMTPPTMSSSPPSSATGCRQPAAAQDGGRHHP
jgi:hypothetical protein